MKLILVLNKVDLVKPKSDLLPLTKHLITLADFEDVFMISGMTVCAGCFQCTLAFRRGSR